MRRSVMHAWTALLLLLFVAQVKAQDLHFMKVDSVNPCLTLRSNTTFYCPVRKAGVRWEEKDVFNPAAVVRNDSVYLLYRAEDSVGRYAGTSRIGVAVSADGLHFSRYETPVLYPDNDAFKEYEWEGGCEDPRIVEDEQGVYYLTYTAYDGHTARLFVATSSDLFHWKKHGSVFRDVYNGRYAEGWSKSGAIVCRQQGDKLIAQRIGGRYWMYWGDTNIYLAHSSDLLHWTPVLADDGGLLPVIRPRPGMFDSDLVEPGPPPLLTAEGILLIYNSRNHPATGDTALPAGTYTAGRVVMDKTSPSRMISRGSSYFFAPDKSYELIGQVNNVCFLEGLVSFKGHWFLYYGTADSRIAVAVGK
ncbi:glycoside hydrolase family 130 protein [Chitinophaga pendula]|uniref:glycoside hydrolase family 130 protein n=1 Tax=Chitinophaga pendula TaxID=2849666 RepID=UPI001CEDFADD|nr:glycoside hydrolase family 130 protein [Chitinophaga pendula]UCJ06324.1 glycoside hydrolase family 130 protein [Chitinophaga pendula]